MMLIAKNCVQELCTRNNRNRFYLEAHSNKTQYINNDKWQVHQNNQIQIHTYILISIINTWAVLALVWLVQWNQWNSPPKKFSIWYMYLTQVWFVITNTQLFTMYKTDFIVTVHCSFFPINWFNGSVLPLSQWHKSYSVCVYGIFGIFNCK